MHDNASDVVFAATVFGRLDNRGCGGIEVVQLQHRDDLIQIVLDAVRHSIRTDHEAISRLSVEHFRFGSGATFFGAEVAIQHVFVAMRLGLFGRDRSGIEQRLRQ